MVIVESECWGWQHIRYLNRRKSQSKSSGSLGQWWKNRRAGGSSLRFKEPLEYYGRAVLSCGVHGDRTGAPAGMWAAERGAPLRWRQALLHVTSRLTILALCI